MPRTRVFGLATVVAATFALAHLAVGCNARGHSGDQCLKDFDCESNHCVQYVCMELGTSPVTPAGSSTTTPDGATDAAQEATADAATDTATAADTTPADTTPADTLVPDTLLPDTALDVLDDGG